jgi:hypothetical protein
MIPSQDRAILRELAKAYSELVAKDANKERIARIKAMHSLKAVRPPVWVEELPWHEMDIGGRLVLRCESEEGRRIEDHFRKTLYKWEFIQADMVVEDTYYIRRSYKDSGIGLSIIEETLSGDNRNHIVSHHYEDQLDTEEKVEALKIPVITAFPEEDKKKLEEAEEIFDGILPVKLRGHEMYYCPWDDIAQLRGMENCLVDMAVNPDLVHKTIQKFTEISVSRYTQRADKGLLDFNQSDLHCTPPYTDELPAKDYTGGPPRLKDVWFRGMAQIFGSASPEMHEEFDLAYMKPFMEKCGLAYYGCCEPLERVIPFLKTVKTMRKIGVTHWADVRSSAEQIGSAYVIARKPSPAQVSGNFNAEAVKKDIKETIEACIENKCPYEFVLKDISTVAYKPQNMIDWINTVESVIDSYYK